MVNLIIDGKKVSVSEETTILEAARQLGIEIPTLCSHSGLIPYGACRVCTVEVFQGERSSIQSSCSYPVEDGLIVKTNSERIKKGRRMILELLLARCPDVKLIQELAIKEGIKKPRFKLKNEDCILCGLCVSTCHQIVGVGAIGLAGRGTDRKVTTPFELPSEICIACGACSYVCPINLLEMEADTIKELRKLPGIIRKCRYMQMGMISHKVCPNSYECYRCEIDQRMEDTFGIHPAFAIRPGDGEEIAKVDGFLVMPEFYYSSGHVWVKRINGKLMIGLDDFASKVLGNINTIKLPPIGSKAEHGKVAWKVTCGKKQANMLFPINGTIIDINPYIEGNSSLIRKDPYGRGWILVVEPDNIDRELNKLLKGRRSRDWIGQESKKLQKIIKSGKDIEDTAKELTRDLPGRLEEKEWKTLINDFFLN